jgi:hypothetical protein
MAHKDEIKSLAMSVDGGLTVYIGIHNAVLRDSGTLKSMLKGLFGRGVSSSKLLEDSEKLLRLWAAIQQKLEGFRLSAYSSLSTDEQDYFDILARYAAALHKTVAALADRQRLLNRGSGGGPNNPVTWEACHEKEVAYQTAIQEYTTIGEELNAAASIIF